MRLVANLFAALLLLLTAQAGSAQSNYPNRPVKILVGFTPGTAPDLAARSGHCRRQLLMTELII